MSAYIQLELDALNVIPRIGMLTGTKPAYVLMGLVELWAYCYRAKCSTIPTATFHAFFVTSPRLLEALQLFGFLDISEDRATLRVRGINRYFGSGKSQAELARKGGIARSTKGVRGPDGRYVRQAEPTSETGNNTQDAGEPKHRSSKRKAVRTPTMESPVGTVLDAPVDTALESPVDARLAHTVKTVNDGQKPSLRAAQPSVQPSHAPLDAPVESRVDARLAHTDAKSTVTVSTARFTVPAPHETSTYNGGDEDEYSIEDALPPLSHSQTSVSAETVRAHRAPPAQTRLADTVHRTDVLNSNAGPATPADSQPYILDPKSYILPSLTGGRDARARVSLPLPTPGSRLDLSAESPHVPPPPATWPDADCEAAGLAWYKHLGEKRPYGHGYTLDCVKRVAMAHPDDFAEAAANMCEMERGWGGKGDVVAWLRRQCTYVAERRADSLKRKPSKAANGFKQPAPQHTEAQKAEFVAAASYTDARMEQWEKSFQRERCALWDKVTASLMRDSERSWDLRQFLTPMGILAIDETRHRLRLIGPDETHEAYVSEHYGRAILAALQEHTGASWEVHYGPRLAAVAEPKPLRVLDMASGASA